MTKFQTGDRVKAKVPTITGWKGTGIVLHTIGDTVHIKRDGCLRGGDYFSEYMNYQVIRTRETIVDVTAGDEQVDTEHLLDAFKRGPLSKWPPEDIAKDKLMRFAHAYLAMARVKYRPAAPSDGMGNIELEPEEFGDVQRLYQEAVKYAVAFNNEEDTNSFWIGCSDWPTNPAFIWAIEAARLLAGGSMGGGNSYAVKLLRMAANQIEQTEKRRK
jgi:hypothetical protein